MLRYTRETPHNAGDQRGHTWKLGTRICQKNSFFLQARAHHTLDALATSNNTNAVCVQITHKTWPKPTQRGQHGEPPRMTHLPQPSASQTNSVTPSSSPHHAHRSSSGWPSLPSNASSRFSRHLAPGKGVCRCRQAREGGAGMDGGGKGVGRRKLTRNARPYILAFFSRRKRRRMRFHRQDIAQRVSPNTRRLRG